MQDLLVNLGNTSDFTMMEGGGRAVDLSTQAVWRLRAIGDPATPFLLDTLAGNDSAQARSRALDTLGFLHGDANDYDDQYLAVYIIAASDSESMVRGIAIGWIAKIVRETYQRHPEDCERLVPYLQEALTDPNEAIQRAAARGLLHTGHRDLIPHDLLEKYDLLRERL